MITSHAWVAIIIAPSLQREQNLEKITFTSGKYDVENAVLGFSHQYVLIHTFTIIIDKPLTKWTDTREISVEISTF